MSNTEVPGIAEKDLNRELKDGLMSHLLSEKYSDFTIRCKEYEQKVHRLVLCSQSKFFDKACNSDFKEGTTIVLELDHEYPAVVEAMIHGMYKLDYQDRDEDFAGGEASPLLLNTAVYAIAAMYDIPAVKRLAATKFEVFTTEHWNKQCFTVFPNAIKNIYQSTHPSDRILRDVAVKVAAANVDVLFDMDCGFDSVAAEIGEFGRDLARCLAGKSSKSEYRCPSCRKTWLGYVFGKGKTFCGQCGKYRDNWQKFLRPSRPW